MSSNPPDNPPTTEHRGYPLMSQHSDPEEYRGVWEKVLDDGGPTDNDGLIVQVDEDVNGILERIEGIGHDGNGTTVADRLSVDGPVHPGLGDDAHTESDDPTAIGEGYSTFRDVQGSFPHGANSIVETLDATGPSNALQRHWTGGEDTIYYRTAGSDWQQLITDIDGTTAIPDELDVSGPATFSGAVTANASIDVKTNAYLLEGAGGRAFALSPSDNNSTGVAVRPTGGNPGDGESIFAVEAAGGATWLDVPQEGPVAIQNGLRVQGDATLRVTSDWDGNSITLRTSDGTTIQGVAE